MTNYMYAPSIYVQPDHQINQSIRPLIVDSRWTEWAPHIRAAIVNLVVGLIWSDRRASVSDLMPYGTGDLTGDEDP